MTLSRITLESFDCAGESSPRVLSAEYQEGFEEGARQSENATEAQHAKALSEISATLSDMAFGYAEARGELLNQIRPILAQIGEVILPKIAQDTFAAHLTETLEAAFKDATAKAIEVAIAPEMVAVFDRAAEPIAAVSDATLALGQARLRHSDTHVMIDLPALVADLQDALQGLEATQRTQTYG